jgi:hypothetical protein
MIHSLRRHPILSLLVFAAVAAALALGGCVLRGGLEADELPSSLNDKHREEIGDVARDFFDGVGHFDPQLASFVTLTPGELGIEEFKRFVMNIGALQSAEVLVEFGALEETSIDVEREVVRATLSTTLGDLGVDLVRREGRWRFASLPDLTMPDAVTPYHVNWSVTHSYVTHSYGPSEGSLVVVGTLDNVGDVTVLELGLGGYILGEDGRSLSTGTSPVLTHPFFRSGESTVFRVDFMHGDLSALDLSRFVLIPNLRVAHEDDESAETHVSVVPQRLTTTEAGTGRELTLTNSDDRASSAAVFAVIRGAGGRPLSLYQSPVQVIPGNGSRRVALPPADAAAIEGAVEVTLEARGSERLE